MIWCGRVASARVYGSCEKVQEWAVDLASNESGVLPSEGVSVGETESAGRDNFLLVLHKECSNSVVCSLFHKYFKVVLY